MSTHNKPFLNIKKIILNYPKSAAICSNFRGTQERVQNSGGKRAISVRAIGVLLIVCSVIVDLQAACMYFGNFIFFTGLI